MSEPMNSNDRMTVLCFWAVALLLTCGVFCVAFGNGPACRQGLVIRETKEYAPEPTVVPSGAGKVSP